jgi:hypothetical protein
VPHFGQAATIGLVVAVKHGIDLGTSSCTSTIQRMEIRTEANYTLSLTPSLNINHALKTSED